MNIIQFIHYNTIQQNVNITIMNISKLWVNWRKLGQIGENWVNWRKLTQHLEKDCLVTIIIKSKKMGKSI